MRKIVTCIALLSCMCEPNTMFAQKKIRKPVIGQQSQIQQPVATRIWSSVPQSAAPAPHLFRHPNVKKYSLYRADMNALKAQFWSIPAGYEQAKIISVPMPDGKMRDFRVWETPMMDADMAARYPDIKTFTAEAVNDTRVTAKFDFTLFGFHYVIFDGEQVSLADPYDNLNDGYYILHYKGDDERPYSQRMICGVHDEDESPIGQPMQLKQHKSLPAINLSGLSLPAVVGVQNTGGQVTAPGTGHTAAELVVNGTTVRTYRLALSANNFYCRAATGLPTPTIAQCLSAATTSINRVNGVYNREIAVQLNFVPDEDLLIWPTATGSSNGPDPFNAINADANSCLTVNQTTCDLRIGSPNYDVGHVFTTGAGGLAGLGVICNNSQKARGVTGSSSPVGDPFDIDYVAHELGHQFGSPHTFNNNQNGSCNGNASAPNAYEPASGVTIMDYAGICSPDNVQSNSSPYFSAASLTRIQTHISGSGGSCAVTTSSGHSVATLASSYTAIYNIPYKTPFELTGPVATGSAGDTAITYGWYQWNLGDFGARLNQTFVYGPIFRSYQPVYDPTRIFPRLSNVLSGVLSNTGEKAPDTTRYLTLKMAVRNVRAGMGCFLLPDDTVHINAFTTGAGNGYQGFRVTSQNTAVTYTGGSTQTITWNVVGTNAAPVNAANVDIFMSVDGGNTWPYTIGTFPNTGTASVSIPNPPVATTQARIKVKGSGNVFFNINGSNFTVNPGPTTAPITGTFTVCVGAVTDLDDATPGGTWSSSTPAVGTVNTTTGVVTGISAGTTTITYHVGTGNVTAVVTVLTTPAVSPITGTAVVCTGSTTTLSDVTAGGAWTSTNTAVGTIDAAGVAAGISAGTTTISYTVTNGCGSTAATRVLTVNAPVAVAAITGATTVCTGLTTAMSNVTPGGAWSSSNTAVGTISAGGVVTGIAAGTTTISYTVTGGGCTSASSVVVTVNTTPTATTTPTGAVTICTGGSDVLTAAPTGAGYTYQWQLAAADIPGATNSTYTVTAGGTYRVLITNTGCTGTSANVVVTVAGSAVVPSVAVSATPGTSVCSAVGTVTFTATPVNGGPTPAYQWFVNGTPAGTSAATYAYAPANGDIVSCELTSSLPCAAPATATDDVTMTVTTSVVPDVTITAMPDDTVCTGSSVTYVATPVNGGATPSFSWTENGIPAATGSSYTTTPANGDVIVCTMTGSAVCATAATATSAPFTMTVQPPAVNVVYITAAPTHITPGSTVTFTAVAPNAGSAALYQWFSNGIAVPGATSQTYVTNDLSDGQLINCRVTTSIACVTPASNTSIGYTVLFPAGVWEMAGSGNAFAVLPNPNNGTFTLAGHVSSAKEVMVHVTNVLGQQLYAGSAATKGGEVSHQISLPAGTPAGVYLLTVTADGAHATFKVTVDK